MSVVFGPLCPALSSAQEICWTQGATQFVAATHYCVTSVLGPQSGNIYGPRGLADGDPRTAWCEGAQGHGIGESITIRIDEGPPFRRLIVRNGYGKSRRTYVRNGRIKTVVITADNSIHTRVDLIDQNGELPIYLPGLAQRWMRLTILDVYPGARFADTCFDFVAPDFVYEEELLRARQAGEPLPPVQELPPTTAVQTPILVPEMPSLNDMSELEELPDLPDLITAPSQ